MLYRIFVLVFVAVSVFGNDIKDDNDEGIKISLEKLKFIPPELLCTLCHNVVNKLRLGLLEDPVLFQTNMLKSCDNYPELEDQVKCRSAFQNKKKIEQLLEPEAPTKMCRTKKLCREDEEPMSPEAFPMFGPRPLPKGMNPIPKIEEPLIPKESAPPPVIPVAPKFNF
ncbi:hypothetical protein FO519_003355 [Halicephalobus sp. NKZ332]|nr:hypothetical protein FO519_003355 [Halicephalobus sp. NKZ332]